MAQSDFDLKQAFRAGLPAPVGTRGGLPRYPFNSGHNDRQTIPVEALAAAAARAVSETGQDLAVYNLGKGPLGNPKLRQFLVDSLAARRGITATSDDVLITSGSGQGIDLINRLLLEKGDTVLIEEFTFAGGIKRTRPYDAQLVAAPLDAEGLDVGRLEAILADLHAVGRRPKYLYIIPTVQNPTGSILSLERRHRLVALARQYRFVIFEDECYADILWDGVEAPPSLYALAPDVTIHIGSFSKTLAPALRVGYIVAPAEVIAQIAALKNDNGTGAIDQMVVAEYFATEFDAHTQRLSKSLRGKLDRMVEALQREFGTMLELQIPLGGIFLWVRFPEHLDVRDLVKAASAAGVAFNPGPEWAVEPESAKSWLRLCFALPTEQQIDEGIAAFARASHEVFGMPTHSANQPNAGAVE